MNLITKILAVTGAGTDKPQDMLDAINRRIDYAREHGARIACKGQNDTVIVRPLVVQLTRENISKTSQNMDVGCYFRNRSNVRKRQYCRILFTQG